MNLRIIMGLNPGYNVVFMFVFFSNNLENNLTYLVAVNSKLMVFIVTYCHQGVGVNSDGPINIVMFYYSVIYNYTFDDGC